MNRKNNGFTLPEMLITMGIIGVIAALTLPQLVGKFTYASYGPTLGSAVQRLELGFRNIIESANKNIVEYGETPLEMLSAVNVEDLFYSDTKPSSSTNLFSDSGKNIFTKAGAILGVEEASGMSGYSYKNFGGGTVDEFKISGTPYKIKKTNAILYYSDFKADSTKLDALVGKILIDVNGADKPNRAGQDVFLFALRNDGKLIPAGSKEYKAGYTSSKVTLATDAAGCNGTGASGVKDGLSCTSRVVTENWNISYMKQ